MCHSVAIFVFPGYGQDKAKKFVSEILKSKMNWILFVSISSI